jgi:hypothetical protein
MSAVTAMRFKTGASTHPSDRKLGRNSLSPHLLSLSFTDVAASCLKPHRCSGGPGCSLYRFRAKPKLHPSPPAADIHIRLGKHFSFDDRRNSTFLAERTDGADPVTCLVLHIGWSHHLRSLAP